MLHKTVSKGPYDAPEMEYICPSACLKTSELNTQGLMPVRTLYFLLLMVPSIAFGGLGDDEAFNFRNGDMVFQESKSNQSRAIAAATGSRYTHMGLVVMRGESPYVLEAVNPVRMRPFSQWRKRGVDGHVVVKRLKDNEAIVSKTNRARMRAIGRKHLGKAYDLTFSWDQKRMYCSELVYRIYLDGAGIALGQVQRFGDMNLKHPLVKALARKRLKQDLDPMEPIVTPVSILEDSKLATVATF